MHADRDEHTGCSGVRNLIAECPYVHRYRGGGRHTSSQHCDEHLDGDELRESSQAARAVRSRLLNSASTTRGSNCVPLFLLISTHASASERAGLYGRSEVIASNVSATAKMRAPRGISLAASRRG